LRDEISFVADGETFGAFFYDVGDEQQKQLVVLGMGLFFHVGDKVRAESGQRFGVRGIDLGDGNFVAVDVEFFQVLGQNVLGGAILER